VAISYHYISAQVRPRAPCCMAVNSYQMKTDNPVHYCMCCHLFIFTPLYWTWPQAYTM